MMGHELSATSVILPEILNNLPQKGVIGSPSIDNEYKAIGKSKFQPDIEKQESYYIKSNKSSQTSQEESANKTPLYAERRKQEVDDDYMLKSKGANKSDSLISAHSHPSYGK